MDRSYKEIGLMDIVRHKSSPKRVGITIKKHGIIFKVLWFGGKINKTIVSESDLIKIYK